MLYQGLPFRKVFFAPAEQSCNIFWHYFLGTKGMVIYENTPVPMAAICLKKARQD
jgi:hypothetical protein